jgi:hypothetical protein
VVSGWRKNRQDNFINRILPSIVANFIISRVTGVHLHDYGCTFKAYRRNILERIQLYGEMHRFIPVYADRAGGSISEIVVNHHPRKHGKTNYGLDRIFRVLLDLFTLQFLMRYSDKPIYLFGGVGMGLMTISSGSTFFLIISSDHQFYQCTWFAFFPNQCDAFCAGFPIDIVGADCRIAHAHIP